MVISSLLINRKECHIISDYIKSNQHNNFIFNTFDLYKFKFKVESQKVAQLNQSILNYNDFVDLTFSRQMSHS